MHKQYSRLSLIIIFISVSLKQYVSKYVNRVELNLVWNECILIILLFYLGYHTSLITSQVGEKYWLWKL